jgi:hypothetical protein
MDDPCVGMIGGGPVRGHSTGLRHLVEDGGCLEKNPEQRFHSASDLSFALEVLPESDRVPAVAA